MKVNIPIIMRDDMYDDLPKNEKDSFRARKSYWKKKGLSEKDAYERAERSYLLRKESRLDNRRDNGRLKIVKDASVNSDRLIKHNTLPQRQETREMNCPINTQGTLQALGYSAIVAAATAVLVSSSLEVFGTDWQGWTKAILLETGIIALVATTGDSQFQKVILKSTMTFLIILSFAVLHTGVETDRHSNLLAATTNSTTIGSLEKERDRYLANHDNLPATHITKRSEVLAKVSELNSKIERQTERLSTGPVSSVVNLKSNTEMMIRAALLLLNIIFGHRLFKLLPTLKWQQIKFS